MGHRMLEPYSWCRSEVCFAEKRTPCDEIRCMGDLVERLGSLCVEAANACRVEKNARNLERHSRRKASPRPQANNTA